MTFQNEIERIISVLTSMGLNEYQASVMSHLLLLGETKATTLSKASNVPSARVYDVLNDLAKMGLITKKPGRPALYKTRPPTEVINLLLAMQRENLRRRLSTLEDKAKDFIKAANKVYLKGAKGTPSVPLLRIVSVGKVSLEETRNLYDAAEKEILILSKAMEYFPEISENLKQAKNRNVAIRIILMSPELLKRGERSKQSKIIDAIKTALGEEAMIRFSDEIPIRGSLVDPQNEGQAIFLVEDPGVPFFLREAAITSHPSVVKGLALMFNLIWKYHSKEIKI